MKKIKKKMRNIKFDSNEYDKNQKEEKVSTKENYIESSLEMKYIALELEKKEIILQTKNQERNWEKNLKDSRDVELTDKREKVYMIRTVNIEKQVKDNLWQNGKKKDVEERSSDNLKGEELIRN